MISVSLKSNVLGDKSVRRSIRHLRRNRGDKMKVVKRGVIAYNDVTNTFLFKDWEILVEDKEPEFTFNFGDIAKICKLAVIGNKIYRLKK